MNGDEPVQLNLDEQLIASTYEETTDESSNSSETQSDNEEV